MSQRPLKHLPYRAVTDSGKHFDFEFDLHPDTASTVHVSNLLDAVLGAVDREIKTIQGIGNGDILQALAMAMAVRSGILPGAGDALDSLVLQLVKTALASSSAPVSADAPLRPKDVH